MKTQTIYDSSGSNSLGNTGQRIFMLIVVLYLLVDISERIINIKYDIWIYAILFAGITLGLFIMAISMLENSIMRRLND